MAGKISDLAFTDFYVLASPREGMGAWYRETGVGSSGRLIPVPADLEDHVIRLRALLLPIAGRERIAMEYEGIRYRVTPNPDVVAGWCFHLHRPELEVRKIDTLGFHPNYVQGLRNIGKGTGLIAIIGAMGSGKTTSASAMMSDWLTIHGGFGQVVTDVEEIPLGGPHGDAGYCNEVLVEDDDGWEPALKKVLSSRGRYVMVNEIRSPAAACQLLRMSRSGQTVVATVHGGRIDEGLESLVQLAARKDGLETARGALADGLAAAIFQKITNGHVDIEVVVAGRQSGDPVRECIRKGVMSGLKDIVSQQRVTVFKIGAGASAPR